METIDTNLDIIEAVKAEVKRVGSITTDHLQSYPSLLAERIVDTPTEQYINGTRSTASGASIDKGIAVLKGLRGKAVKVNQLFSLQEYDERAGLAIHASSNGKFTIVGTTTQSVAFGIYNVSLDNRPHKFVVKAKTTKASSPTFTLWLKSNYTQSVAVGNSVGDTTAVVNCTTDGSSLIFVIQVAEGDVYDWEGSIQAVDLTALGWDDISTYEEFLARWKAYYGSEELPNYYTEGEILVSKPSRLISKDADGDVLDSLAITLPSLFADGILSVGDVADEWGTKATKRVGVKVFDGTENWEIPTGNIFALPQSWYGGDAPKYDGNNVGNVACALYHGEKAPTNWSLVHDKSINLWNYQYSLLICDSAYASLDAWKSHLAELYAQGNPLVILYELATPIEEQTPFPIGFYKAEPNGTEEVQDAESIPTLLDGFIGYEGMDTIANLASAWGIDADKVGKVIVTGTENWQLADSGYYAGLFVIRVDALPVGSAEGRGSAIPYKGWNNANPTGMPDGYIIGPSGYYSSTFFTSEIRDSRFASLDAWKAHLADLYASGCPLTIYYEKA